MITKIQELRQKFGYTQEYLAKEIGVSRPTYMQIEKGKCELTVSQAIKLSALFDMTLEEFLGNKEQIKRTVVLESAKRDQKKPDIRIEVPADKVKKFKEILLYVFSKIGAQPNFGQTVLYKLLYFIDFDYYEKYREKLIGATYIKNHYGPTPVEFKEVIAEMEKEKSVEILNSKYFQYQQKKYLPLRDSNLTVLSGREKEFIDKTLSHLADKNAKRLSDYSHGDAPWKLSEAGRKIDYDFVFYREHPYTDEEYFPEAKILSMQAIEESLGPVTDEEIKYYEEFVKKHERKNNKMR